MKSFIDKNFKKYIYNLLGVLFIFLVWFLLSKIYNNSLVVPQISDVIRALFKILAGQRIYGLIMQMIEHIILTVIVSFAIAFILAICSFKSNKFNQFISPVLTIMKTVPIVVIIILLLMSLGMTVAPYVATTFVIIPIIYEVINTTLKHIDPAITDDLKTISNINFKVIFKFYFPLIFPNIITSLIQSFGLGLKVMIMSEFISPKSNTFGAEIKRYYELNRMEEVYAIVFIVICFVLIIDKILKIIREKTYTNIY